MLRRDGDGACSAEMVMVIACDVMMHCMRWDDALHAMGWCIACDVVCELCGHVSGNLRVFMVRPPVSLPWGPLGRTTRLERRPAMRLGPSDSTQDVPHPGDPWPGSYARLRGSWDLGDSRGSGSPDPSSLLGYPRRLGPSLLTLMGVVVVRPPTPPGH